MKDTGQQLKTIPRHGAREDGLTNSGVCGPVHMEGREPDDPCEKHQAEVVLQFNDVGLLPAQSPGMGMLADVDLQGWKI